MRICTDRYAASVSAGTGCEKHLLGQGAPCAKGAGSRQRNWLVSGLLSLLSLCGSHQAMAAECQGNPPADIYTFPSPISVPRDRNTYGIPLTTWVEGPANSNWWECIGQDPGIEFMSVTSNGMKYTEAGGTYNVFDTGLPGVGLIFAFREHIEYITCAWFEYRPWNYDSNKAHRTCNGNPDGNWSVGGQVKMRLIQTGPISAGTTSAFTPVQAYGYPSWNSGTNKLFTVNPVTFNTLSCLAEGMNVTLPSVQKSEFNSSITPKVTPFQFTLRNCPAGMDSVSYQVTPMSPIITSADGTFANNTGTGMALGVGLRITDSANTAAVDFATTYPVADYSPTSGNSALPIPMNVSYFRTDTADAVTPGRVQGALQMTVFYN
ncbi:hypothetical protein C1886_13510 [Pseudomonas sp. FW300-N1A1]|nr:hypothetical protein C1886_13510 [Pseudomonas sp. FW300-N1A1]